MLAFAKAFEDAAAAEIAVLRPTPVVVQSRPVNEPRAAEVPVSPERTVKTTYPAGVPTAAQRTMTPAVTPAGAPEWSARRNSVTQMFFDEGEHKEQGNWTAADLEEPASDPEAAFDSFDDVPRRRSRFVLPLVLVGGLGAAALPFFSAGGRRSCRGTNRCVQHR